MKVIAEVVLLPPEERLPLRTSSNDGSIENCFEFESSNEFLVLSSRFSNESYYFAEFPSPKHS